MEEVLEGDEGVHGGVVVCFSVGFQSASQKNNPCAPLWPNKKIIRLLKLNTSAGRSFVQGRHPI